VDPAEAIADFAAQLDRRGIRLVLLPVPVKPMVHPEQLSRRFAGRRDVLQNPSYLPLIRRLGDQVTVLDPAPMFARLKWADGGRPVRELYLRTDTHWRPEAMDLVAARLAEVVTAELAARGAAPPARAAPAPREVVTWATNVGDVARMLQPLVATPSVGRLHASLGEWLSAAGAEAAAAALRTDRRDLLPREIVTLRSVVDADGSPLRPDRAADVLLLGDSFSNIYSAEPMGWGSGAGLPERLSFHLGRPVDTIVRNDAGAHATRKLLSDELRAGRDRLAGKRVVVWQFAVRELAVGDWRIYPMALSSAPGPGGGALRLGPGERIVVTGRIESMTRPPRPATVPYKDHIMAVRLRDVRDEAGRHLAFEAVVFTWGMRDKKHTPAARLREGRQVTAGIRPWADVVGRHGTIRRSELDDVDVDTPLFWCDNMK
jgi:hypothetical protein